MNSVVVFDSRSGNTKRVAAAIAEALGASGSVEMVAATDASATVSDHHDLVVVGGPTEGRHATPAIEAFFDRLPTHALRGIAAAAFDTRLDWPRLLSGSAASDIQGWMRSLEAEVLVGPESFHVSQRPSLKDGELDRASRWASDLAARAHDRMAEPTGAIAAAAA